MATGITSETFKALGDPTRLALFELLLERPRHVSELVDALSLAQSRVSRHLRILRDSGLIEDHRDGRWVLYRVAPGEGSATALLAEWASRARAGAGEGSALPPRGDHPRRREEPPVRARGPRRRPRPSRPAIERPAPQRSPRPAAPVEEESSFVVRKIHDPLDPFLL